MTKKYNPRRGQAYWMLNSRWEVVCTTLTKSLRSKGRVEAGNAFRTQADAEEFRQHMLDTADRLTKPWWRFW